MVKDLPAEDVFAKERQLCTYCAYGADFKPVPLVLYPFFYVCHVMASPTRRLAALYCLKADKPCWVVRAAIGPCPSFDYRRRGVWRALFHG